MRTRHPALPRLWLMTDERLGNRLWDALGRLPRGSGVVFRHHATPAAERRALYARVRRIARARRLVLLTAGRRLRGAAGVHNGCGGCRRGIVSRSVHDARQLVAAGRAGADLVFVSPVFPTRSHLGGRTLGRVRFGALATRAPMPVIALGGLDPRRARSLAAFGIHGWAGIDALA